MIVNATIKIYQLGRFKKEKQLLPEMRSRNREENRKNSKVKNYKYKLTQFTLKILFRNIY